MPGKCSTAELHLQPMDSGFSPLTHSSVSGMTLSAVLYLCVPVHVCLDCCLCVPETELNVSCRTTKLHHQLYFDFYFQIFIHLFILLEMGYHYRGLGLPETCSVAQASVRVTELCLTQLPECWRITSNEGKDCAVF